MYLGIETTTPLCSISLFNKEVVIDVIDHQQPKSHSGRVTLLIEEIMRRNQLGWTDLSGIVYGDGPGSYTGLRIGASVAKGLCFVHDLPLFSICSLTAQAMSSYASAGEAGIHIGCADARRKDIYISCWGPDNGVSPVPALWSVDTDLIHFCRLYADRKIFIAGQGHSKLEKGILPKNVIILTKDHSAQHFRSVFHYLSENELIVNHILFEPHYMQKPNITTPKPIWD